MGARFPRRGGAFAVVVPTTPLYFPPPILQRQEPALVETLSQKLGVEGLPNLGRNRSISLLPRQMALRVEVQCAKCRGIDQELGIHRETVRLYVLAEGPPTRRTNVAARKPQSNSATAA